MDPLNRTDLSHNTLQNLPSKTLYRILMKCLYSTQYDWVKTKQFVSDDALLLSFVHLRSVSSAWMIRLNKLRRKDIEAKLYGSPVIVGRDEWFARDHASDRVALMEPVSMVVIDGSVEPDEGFDERRCKQAVQYIQNYCMDVKGWADIAYNFLIGEDGRVYEGRGWKVHGAHTLGYNDSAIGIGFIGLFERRAPREAALRAAHQLIRLGIKESHIEKNYSLHCLRDLRPAFESPGKYLYEIIKGWPNYEATDQ